MKIYVTRNIPGPGIKMLEDNGHQVVVSKKDGVLTKDELIAELKADQYDGVLCLLTDQIDADIFDAVPTAKIFANYAVGYNNIDVEEAKNRNIVITNTPGVLTEAVAEHTFALMLAVMKRIPEADQFTRAGKYVGWAPELLLGEKLGGKTLGILGAGRIGAQVARYAVNGFGMKLAYYDIKKNDAVEKEFGAQFFDTPEALMSEVDVVSVHVPLLDSTRHLVNKERLHLMKPTAYLINTSRGPVVDEKALVEALKEKHIKGAALDVFEDEPALAPGLAELPNVVLTPHIASATEDARGAMSRIAAENLIAHFSGKEVPNNVS